MSGLRPALALGALLFTAIRPAAAEEPPSVQIPATLNLPQALEIFRAHGFDLLIAEAAVMSSEADLRIAGSIPNLTASIGYYRAFFDRNLFETENGWFVSVGDGNAIEDSLSGKRTLRQDVARRALDAARMTRADAQRTLEFQVKQAFSQAVQARATRDFAREVLVSATQTAELIAVRYKAGAVSEAEVSKAETASLEAEQAVDTSEQALRQAKVALAFLMGSRSLTPDFTVDPDALKFAVPPGLTSASRQSLLETATEHRPDLRAIGFQRERAEAQLSLNRRLRFPDLSLNLQYSQQGSSSGTGGAMPISPISPPTLQVSVSGTIPAFYQQQGEILKAEADIRTQSVQRAKIEAQIANDVEAAWAAFDTSKRLVTRMESQLLDKARRTRELVGIQYQKGAASLLELLDAQRTYIATNVEYLQDLTNYWTAVFQLEQAVGVELR